MYKYLQLVTRDEPNVYCTSVVPECVVLNGLAVFVYHRKRGSVGENEKVRVLLYRVFNAKSVGEYVELLENLARPRGRVKIFAVKRNVGGNGDKGIRGFIVSAK